MKRVLALLGALAVLLGSAFLAYQILQPLGPEEVPELAEDVDPVLDFAAETQTGDAVMLSDFIGQEPTLAFFWTSWCGACKIGMEVLTVLHEQVGDAVQILAVNLSTMGHDELALGRAFMEENDLPFSSIYDIEGEAARLYGVNAVPLMLFIGTDGGIHHRHLGVMPLDSMVQILEQMG